MKVLNAATGKPRIDTAKIPNGVRLSIGAAIYKAVLQDMERPDFQEGFERWMAERNAAAKGAADGDTESKSCIRAADGEHK